MEQPSAMEMKESQPFGPDEDRRFVAKYALHPIQHAARAVGTMTLHGDSHLDDLCTELGDLVQVAKAGDMGRSVTTLVAQAHTLEAVFYYLLGKATSPNCYGSEIELYLRPALKAQAQCRRTVETLATLANPRSVAIVQTNIGTHIQMSNSTIVSPQKAPNKLMEQSNGTRLDAGATMPAIKRDSPVAALEAVKGTQNSGR
jgi:hypothetical protein